MLGPISAFHSHPVLVHMLPKRAQRSLDFGLVGYCSSACTRECTWASALPGGVVIGSNVHLNEAKAIPQDENVTASKPALPERSQVFSIAT